MNHIKRVERRFYWWLLEYDYDEYSFKFGTLTDKLNPSEFLPFMHWRHPRRQIKIERCNAFSKLLCISIFSHLAGSHFQFAPNAYRSGTLCVHRHCHQLRLLHVDRDTRRLPYHSQTINLEATESQRGSSTALLTLRMLLASAVLLLLHSRVLHKLRILLYLTICCFRQ
jgi:hypothetical protein